MWCNPRLEGHTTGEKGLCVLFFHCLPAPWQACGLQLASSASSSSPQQEGWGGAEGLMSRPPPWSQHPTIQEKNSGYWAAMSEEPAILYLSAFSYEMARENCDILVMKPWILMKCSYWLISIWNKNKLMFTPFWLVYSSGRKWRYFPEPNLHIPLLLSF